MYHHRNGWHFGRNEDGSVSIEFYARDRAGHVTTVNGITLSASEWCAIVALVSATGKSAKSVLEAIHNGTQVQRAETSSRAKASPRVSDDQGGGASGEAGTAAGGKGAGDQIASPEVRAEEPAQEEANTEVTS